jgi:hypothetical protein
MAYATDRAWKIDTVKLGAWCRSVDDSVARLGRLTRLAEVLIRHQVVPLQQSAQKGSMIEECAPQPRTYVSCW